MTGSYRLAEGDGSLKYAKGNNEQCEYVHCITLFKTLLESLGDETT